MQLILRTVLRYAFVPAAVASAVASLVYQRELGAWMRMDGATVGLLMLVLAVLVAEKLAPARDGWNYNLFTSPDEGWAELGRDLLYFFGITQVSVLAVKGADAVLRHALPTGPLVAWWPVDAPVPLRVLLAFFCVELLDYAYHRAAHAVPLLWQFHSTHHAVTGLVGLKALRTHPLDNVAFHVVRTAPLLLLGLAPTELAGALYLGGFLGILAHANVDAVPLPGLDWFVNYPRFHAVHHSEDEPESRTNYGCHTVLFDRLFGTFRGGVPPPVRVGLPGGRRTAWEELGWPLYRDVRTQARATSGMQ